MLGLGLGLQSKHTICVGLNLQPMDVTGVMP